MIPEVNSITWENHVLDLQGRLDPHWLRSMGLNDPEVIIDPNGVRLMRYRFTTREAFENLMNDHKHPFHPSHTCSICTTTTP